MGFRVEFGTSVGKSSVWEQGLRLAWPSFWAGVLKLLHTKSQSGATLLCGAVRWGSCIPLRSEQDPAGVQQQMPSDCGHHSLQWLRKFS